MYKHPVTYIDFNGNERKEDLYFHLSVPEVTRLEAEIGMSMEKYIKEVTANQKLDELLGFLEKILLNAYGVKTLDGKSFRKTKEIREEFEYSQAYAEVFEQMVTDPEVAKRFGENVADKGQARKNQVAPKVVTDKQEN